MIEQIPTPIPPTQVKKNSWFGKIETQDEALEVIKGVSIGFYFLAVLQIVIGYFLIGLESIIDGVIYAVLAFLLRKFNSRVVAVILLLISIASIVFTGINQFAGGTGGKNTILAVITVWASIRAIQATFKLHKLQHQVV